jgi:hypothetical protein
MTWVRGAYVRLQLWLCKAAALCEINVGNQTPLPSIEAIFTNPVAVIPRVSASNWLVISSTHQLSFRPVGVVAPPRQPSQLSLLASNSGQNRLHWNRFRCAAISLS